MPERWYVQPNDEIGGWCVMSSDDPPSAGKGRFVADFCDERTARRIVELHSAEIAGRLLPEGGETRTEWGVRSTGDYAIDCTDDDEAHRWAARDVQILRERGRDAALIRRPVQEWPDKSTFTGPWVAVDQEATDA